MNDSNRGLIRRSFSAVWQLLNSIRTITLNLLFFGLVIVFILAITNDNSHIEVPHHSALLLNLKGDIVEQKVSIDPFDAFLNESFNQNEPRPEILLSNVINVINKAGKDDRVAIMVLKLDQLNHAGLTKLQDIGQALSAFKSTGKTLIALGDQFSQNQYYLASFADEIWLDPRGFMLLDGFGQYQLYYKTALEKLSVTPHIFRVGTYKSAVEPYIRDNMSEEAKVANKLWLNDLWHLYKQDVAKNRGFDTSNFDETAEQLITKFTASNGNFAEYAHANGWVDRLKTREQMRSELIDKVGKNKTNDDFNYISYKDYLTATSDNIPDHQFSQNQVAIIVAKGAILDGYQPPGIIGGDSTAQLLREARLDNNVKAVVLRVDSPGGSAYASDIIRQEIELIKKAGKPVVASMGTLAASGGYWISAPADKIIASPSTITGSIGIFGMFMTVENTLSKVGVYTDGVGTTELSGFGITRPLSDGMSKLFQLSINRGYQDFINLVAQHRKMSAQDVDKIAQGRVWSGIKAKEIGLVDELGSLDDAIIKAAELAELTDYKQKLFEQKPSAKDLFLQNLLESNAHWIVSKQPHEPLTQGVISSLYQRVNNEIQTLEQFNDPQGVYSFCLTCDLN